MKRLRKEKDHLERSDLSTLSIVSSETITHCLRTRYNENKIYTNIGSRHLVALNPLKELNDDQTSLEYAAYKDHLNHSSESHLFDLINRIYSHMRRTESDQVIALRGVCGSGKSDIAQWTIRHLVELSNHKKESKLETQIAQSQKILEAFGHCQTETGASSSRFGHYSEIQFNKKGRIVGLKVLSYVLETSRVTTIDCSPLEGNFNIFYYLLAGVSRTEKSALQLAEPASYTYLQKFRKRTLLPTDAHQFEKLKVAMKTCGFKKERIGRIFQLVATILHLGNLTFINPAGLGTQGASQIKNTELLNLAAEFLGLDPQALESALTYKTTMIREDITTIILSAQQASHQRDELCQTLYSLLFSWIVEKINDKVCQEDFDSFIGILDFPGLMSHDSLSGFNSLCTNLANERIQDFVDFTLLENNTNLFGESEIQMPNVSYQSSGLNLMTRHKGILHEINTMTDTSKRIYTDRDLIDTLIKHNSDHPAFFIKASDNAQRHFIIKHYGDTFIGYSTDGLLAQNNCQLSIDFMSLFNGNSDIQSSWNPFIVDLFANIKTRMHSKHNTIIAAEKSVKPTRAPSRRKKGNKDETYCTILSETQSALDELTASFEEAKLWIIYCILPRYKESDIFDSTLVHSQLDSFKIPLVLQSPAIHYVEAYDYQEFLEYYGHLFQGLDSSLLPCKMIANTMGWTERDILITQNKVFLSARAWYELEVQLGLSEKVEYRRKKEVSHTFSLSTHDAVCSEDESEVNDGSESYGSQNGGLEILSQQEPTVEEEGEKNQMTSERKQWLFFVYLCTCCIPSPLLVWLGKMKRKEVRVAWREKVTLCLLIFVMCGFILWFLVYFGESVCPTQNVYSISELQNHDKMNPKGAYVAIRGEVFHLTRFLSHHSLRTIVPDNYMLTYGGTDATSLFPVQVSALCEGVSPYVSIDYQVNLTDINAPYHDFRYTAKSYKPNWYYNQMSALRSGFKVSNMGYGWSTIFNQSRTPTVINGVKTLRVWGVIDNSIYDITSYSLGGRIRRGPNGTEAGASVNTNFLNERIVEIFREQSGTDLTATIKGLNLDEPKLQRELGCLRNLFYVGELDKRNSAKCQFAAYLMLIVTVLMASVVIFKFLTAIRIGGKLAPEEHDKFVICQITCYTEDDESLQKTIDSIGRLRYDDKRKLLFVICDGMIVGSGNDKPTPRIVLDILGVDSLVDPEPLSFVSLGEGKKQHNMGKVYSGLYEVSGHVVPYIVVAKCGYPGERQKPGNRGKRDSQLVLMQFLNRVHYNAPMSPLQLEIYHQMKNVIGVKPEFYEFVLMVDADTEVMPNGLNYLVSSVVHDSKIIGICGETNLSNEKATWVTMIQVYEYFISHHLIKSFESLFSTVSCLPGCFTMYRVRTVHDKRPLFISNEIIADYSVNIVDTLHKKNLLHLGEDRYLTTLLLKHFASFKTKFNSDAQCMTNAPDVWSVLISQRRRWINSTVHNLGELVFLPRLCGICCFSMRFVVILDLIGTLVMPALMGYLGYLIYSLATLDGNMVPIISIATIAGTYSVQAVLFMVKGRWEFIVWLLVSILAMPVFSFYIPIYAYWHFDDFSWGNTRVVVGEKGEKMAVAADDGTFDPKSIPTMKWSEYEQKMTAEDRWSDKISNISSGYTRPSLLHPFCSSAYGMIPDNMNVNSATQPLVASFDMPIVSNFGSGVVSPFATMQQQSARYIHMNPLYQFNRAGSSCSMITDVSNHTDRPSNEEIMQKVHCVMDMADLTKITKKQVREELQSFFGVSMSSRKDYINACIENNLKNRNQLVKFVK